MNTQPHGNTPDTTTNTTTREAPRPAGVKLGSFA